MRIKIDKTNIGVPLVVRSSYKFISRTYGLQEAEVTLANDGEYILTVDGYKVATYQNAAKRSAHYKDAIIEVSTQMRQAIEAYNDAFVLLANKTMPMRYRSSIEGELLKLNVTQYERAKYDTPKPNKSEVESDLREEANARFFSVWSSNSSQKDEFVSQRLEEEYNKRVANWDALKQYHESIQDYFEIQKNKQYQDEYNIRKKALEDDLYGNVAFVTKNFNELPSKCVIPFDVLLECDYNQKEGIINATANLPSILNIPDKKVEAIAYDKISIKHKLKREIEADTANTLLGLSYYLAGHLFSLSVNINIVRLSVMTCSHAYYWIEFDRKGFVAIPISNLYPLQDFFHHPNVIEYRNSVIELMKEYDFRHRVDDTIRVCNAQIGNGNLIVMSITQAEAICNQIEGAMDLKEAIQDAKKHNSTVVIANKRYQNVLNELRVN